MVNVLAAQAGPKWLLQEGAFVGFGFLGSSFMILQDLSSDATPNSNFFLLKNGNI